MMNIGIYIHIPFCRKKCDYCNFFSIPLEGMNKLNQDGLIENYIDRLLHEIEERSSEFMNYKVDTIYFGGGTPSFINPEYIHRLLQTIFTKFRMCDKEVEITLECNPEDFELSKITEYKNIGITRLVLGVQTLNERLHIKIGRSSAICNDKILDEFFGIDGIDHCIDLLTGIPEQTEADLSWELNKICDYNPVHISLYILSIEAGSRLYNRISMSSELEELQKKLFEEATNILRRRSFVHYEVSNFALFSFESKHNIKYWKFLPYIGFGPGAHSFYGNNRFHNPSSVKEYIQSDVLNIVKDDRTSSSGIVEYIMTGMRLIEGISLKDFETKLKISFPKFLMKKIIELEGRGDLIINYEEDDISIKFTHKGFFSMDSLIYDIVEVLL